MEFIEHDISQKITNTPVVIVENEITSLGLKRRNRTTVNGKYHFVIVKISPITGNITISKLYYHNNHFNDKSMIPTDVLPNSPWISVHAIPACKELLREYITQYRERITNNTSSWLPAAGNRIHKNEI